MGSRVKRVPDFDWFNKGESNVHDKVNLERDV